MKYLFKFSLLTVLLFGITIGVYGCKKKEPEGYNLKVVNETDIEFEKIGIANEKNQIVGAIVDKNIEKNDSMYFFNDEVKNEGEYVLKAMDKNGKVYESIIEIKGKKVRLTGIEGGKLVSDSESSGNINTEFDILKVVKNWEFKVSDNLVESSFESEETHSTSVMGAGGKLGYSDDVAANEKALSSWEKGKVNYAWIEVKLNK